MKKIEFLIIGKNQPILETLTRLVNANEEWHGEGFSEELQAKDYFSKNTLDIVLFSSGINEDSERDLRSFFVSEQPEIEIIQHYGGGSGLLKCEILEALEQRRQLRLLKNRT